MKKFIIFTLSISFLLIFLSFLLNLEKNIDADIYIERGQSVKDISLKLQKKGIILNKELFLLYSLLRNKPLKAGYYVFKGNYSIIDVWNKIYKGEEDLVKITIIAGDDLFTISEKLDKKGIIKKEKFLNLSFDKKFLEKIGVDYQSFEGFIYPDTYFLPKNMPVEKLFNYFLDRFKNEYNLNNLKDENFYKKMIIASLLEKEASDFKEKRIIAGIIYKRLKIRMPLQIDATVIYAEKLLNLWDGKILRKDYKINSSFNTYKIYGLPPTPISSFSKESLYAAEYPEDTPYLYYFSKNGKTHIFSKTYKEHLKKLKMEEK